MMPRSISGRNLKTWTVWAVDALLVLLCLSGAFRLNAQQSVMSKTSVASKSLVGQPAPQFVVSTIDGKAVSLADYRGKAVLVNFWATWCGNCKVEMPWLAELRDKYASQGFEVLGILTDDAPPNKIAAIVQKYGVKYPILMCNHKTAQAYGGLPYLPESFFIDKHGAVVLAAPDTGSKEEIEANIRQLLRLGAK